MNNRNLHYTVYSESKYDAGTCIKMPETIFFGNRISITNDFTKIKIHHDVIPLEYVNTTRTIIDYNYGGILGPQKTQQISEIFKLSTGETLDRIWVAKHSTDIVFDKIIFRQSEYRPLHYYKKQYFKYKTEYLKLKSI